MVMAAEWESRRPHLGSEDSGTGVHCPRPSLGAAPTEGGPHGSDWSARPWSEGATFCMGTPALSWARPGTAMGASQPEGSLRWGALHRLMPSGSPGEDSARRFPGGTRSEPPGLPVTHPPSPDPRFYQEIRERGLNTSHESDDDLLDEPSSPDGTGKADAPIVVKSYRPAQITWSQLPEVRPGRWGDALCPSPRAIGPSKPVGVLPVRGGGFQKYPPMPSLQGVPLPGTLRAALLRGHSGSGPEGRRAAGGPWPRRMGDEPPTGEPLALARLRVACGAVGRRTPLRGPGERREGPRGEMAGEGRGPCPRAVGVSGESSAGTEALVL